MSTYVQNEITFNNVKEGNYKIKAFPIYMNGLDGVHPEYGGIINIVNVDWNGAEVGGDVVINTTGDLLSWIKNCIESLQEENQALRDRVAALEQGAPIPPEPVEPEEKNYNVLIDVTGTPTVEDIIAAIDPEVEKPEEVQLMNMSELSGVTDTYLVYPLEWEVIENDMIVSPIIKDWNGFEIGFSINEEIPTVMVNDVEYRVSDIQLGKGNYTIEFR